MKRLEKNRLGLDPKKLKQYLVNSYAGTTLGIHETLTQKDAASLHRAASSSQAFAYLNFMKGYEAGLATLLSLVYPLATNEQIELLIRDVKSSVLTKGQPVKLTEKV